MLIAQKWQGPRENGELLEQKGQNQNDTLLQLKSQDLSEHKKLVAQKLHKSAKMTNSCCKFRIV